MRHLFIVMLLLCASLAFAQSKSSCSSWDGLIGTWDAAAAADGSTGSTTFERDVQNKVIVRHNRAEYPATKDRPASLHDDLMVVYDDPTTQDRRAIYWDNEGHVIRYIATASADGCTLTLVAEPGTAGPHFRLTYTIHAPASIAGLFEIATPNAPSTFKKYLEWTMHRRAAKTQ